MPVILIVIVSYAFKGNPFVKSKNQYILIRVVLQVKRKNNTKIYIIYIASCIDQTFYLLFELINSFVIFLAVLSSYLIMRLIRKFEMDKFK